MKKVLLAVIGTAFLFYSCKDSTPSQNSANLSKELLSDIVKEYGGDTFWSSTSTFNYGNISYSMKRKSHILESSMSITSGGKYHLATYSNGFSQYFIDSISQDSNLYKKIFIDAKLDAFIYLLSIPHVFTGTDVYTKDIQDAEIDGKQYKTIYVSYKFDPDETGDEFYLYIDPERKKIDYISYKYKLSGQIAKFRKFYNFRSREGIIFTDYKDFILRSRDTIPLREFYKAYNDSLLTIKDDVVITNIEVTPTP